MAGLRSKVVILFLFIFIPWLKRFGRYRCCIFYGGDSVSIHFDSLAEKVWEVSLLYFLQW